MVVTCEVIAPKEKKKNRYEFGFLYLHQYCCNLKQFSVFLFHGLCWFRHEQKFAKMARYDMSGIGINLRELPDENGMVRLKVLGLLLDGPAHSAGIRQVRELSHY